MSQVARATNAASQHPIGRFGKRHSWHSKNCCLNGPCLAGAICMKFLLAAALLTATAIGAVEPAHAQPCFTAEACRALRLQQEAVQERAAANAQQQADVAAQQANTAAQRRRQAAAQHSRALEQQRIADEQARIAAERQQQENYERQQVAAQQAKLDAEQKAAAQRDAAARARLIEETRVANLRAAEASPDNYCKEPSNAGKVIDYYNSLVKAGDAAYTTVDIEHLITEQFDSKARTMSCHGTFVLTNGNRRSGSVVARPNVAGTIIVSFHETQN
jgi:hypothetical protein